MNIEDGIIIAEIRNRNLKVYESLFLYYYSPLVKFADGFTFERHESEDIVQNLFVYLWENSHKIEITVSLKSYLFQSVRNRCLNFLRDFNIRDRNHLLYLESLITFSREEEDADSGISDEINKAISQLPQQMAEVVRLRYVEGKKIKEIVSLHDITQNTVKTHLTRAKQKLRKIIDKKILFFFFNFSLLVSPLC